MLEWLQNHQIVATTLAAVSVLTFVATLIGVPIFAVRIPPDYFVDDAQKTGAAGEKSALARLTLGLLKTVLGIVLILIGILMLVLPGQGILTILMGLILVNFPGTSRLVCWMLTRPPVWRSINWLRKRAGRPALAESSCRRACVPEK